MTAPDFSRGFLRVPHPVWEALVCRAPLTRRQLQLAAVVLRESWGWQTKGGGVRLWTRPLSTGDFARATGLATDRIARDLSALERRGLLLRHGRCWQLAPAALAVPAREAAREAARQQKAERAPEQRSLPAGTASADAGSAPAPSGVKTGQKSKRNDVDVVAPLPDRRRGAAAPVPRRPVTDQATARAALFVRLVEATGNLSPMAHHRLETWVARAGVAAVWDALAPGFPDPAWLRQRLEQGEDPDSPTANAEVPEEPASL